MRQLVLKYGLIGGAITSVLMVLAMRFQDEIGFEYGVFVGLRVQLTIRARGTKTKPTSPPTPPSTLHAFHPSRVADRAA